MPEHATTEATPTTAMAAQTTKEAEAPRASGSQAYQPNILDLSSGVARPWPLIPDLALSLVLAGVTLVATDEYFGPITAICGALEAAVFVLLVTRYARVRPHRLTWIECVFAVHYSEFGLPVVSDPSPVGVTQTIPRQDSFEFASVLALASALVMIGGFFFARRGARRFSGDAALPRLSASTFSAGARLYFALALAYFLLNENASIHEFILPVRAVFDAFVGLTALLVVTTGAYLVQPKLLNFLQMLAAFLLLVRTVADSSMLGDAVVPLLGIAALWWRGRERLPIIPLAAIAATLIVLQPVKAYYRGVRWNNQSNVGIVEGWQEAFSLASAESHSAFGHGQGGTDAALARLSELSSTAYVVEVVPGTVPHTDGLIYPMMLVSWVPRILWPDKPNMTKYALDPFAIALGLVEKEGADSTTTGVSLLAQGYLEHGVPGSIGWMALLGVMLGLVSRYFGTTLAGTIAGASLMTPWAQAVPGGFYNTFGGVWQYLLGSTLFVWLLGRGYRPPATPLPTPWNAAKALTTAPRS